MHLDGAIILAGLIVGFAVGMTGVGGGALMTPVLVLLLGVTPSAAVSSDLVASVFMKPIAGAVHLRRKTVHKGVVLWLLIGSVPAAFAGAATLNLLAHGKALQSDIELALGAALLLAVAGIVVRSLTAKRPTGTVDESPAFSPVRPVPTLLVGLLGGFIVGMTSVGSGSLMIVAMMFIYPRLTGRQLVGTDLVQSVPLVASAAIGQAVFGHIDFSVTASLLIGSLPAVYLGARLSAVAPTAFLRPAIAILLLASALKLVKVPTAWIAVALVASAAIVVAFSYGRRLQDRRRRGTAPVRSDDLASQPA